MDNKKTGGNIGFIIVLVIAIIFCFASCGGGDKSYDPKDDPDYDRVYNYYKYGTWD